MSPMEFDVEVREPDPEASDIKARKTACVLARLDGKVVGSLHYGFLAEEVWITSIDVEDAYKRRGCATEMVRALCAHFPTKVVRDGGSSNTPEGDLLLSSLRDIDLVASALPSEADGSA